MDLQENILTRIIRTLLDKGIIQVVSKSSMYALTTGTSGGAVGVAINILWELLQEIGGQIYNRLRERRSDNSIFAIIRDEILKVIKGVSAMNIIRSLIQRAIVFLQGLAGKPLVLSTQVTKKCIG